jgi:rubrerythrin
MSEWTAELYVHAIAMEREAAERYAELAQRMDGQGNLAVAALFRLLARLEKKHLDDLRRRSAGLQLPALTADYTWPDSEAPETTAREAALHGVTQRHALEIALQGEKRARAFFEQSARVAPDPQARGIALEMAAEEAEHALLIQRMLERMHATLYG